jgi:hypothetical protein
MNGINKMFNLELSIADWRKKMLAAGIKTPVPLEELESHLRDEIERQTQSGRSEAEAFKSAIQKIGPMHSIQNEFEKVEANAEECRWKKGRNALVTCLSLASVIFGGTVLLNEMTFGQRMAGLAAVATMVLLAGVGRLSYRIFPAIPDRRNRVAIIVISGGVPWIVWGWMFDRYILPGHQFPFGQLWAAVLWSACPPCGVFFGLCLGIGVAARKKVAPAGS